MRKFTFNWGAVLASVVLLAYTYISFLGMLYKVDGVAWKAVLFAFAVIAIVSACVYFMVNAKVTKSKDIGVIGQILLGLVILGAFLFSGAPFTSFLKVAGNRDKIEREIAIVKQLAAGIDSTYNVYAYDRVHQYKRSLDSGDELRVKSLQRRLLPETLLPVQSQRQEWVSQIENMTIWNIMLPQNLKYMQQCVNDWSDNYNQLSSIAYDGQQLNPFEYSEFQTKLDGLMNDFKNAGYSFWAVLVAIIAALAMLVPYWLAIPTQTRKTKNVTYVKQVKHS